MDIFLGANVFQNLRPDAYGDFAKVGFAEYQHESARLADTTTNAERNVVFQDGLVVGEFQEVELSGQFKLLFQGFGVDANAHRAEFVTTLGDMVPDQNVAIEAMTLSAVDGLSRCDPIVVIRCAHFVRIAVLERMADAGDEEGWALLEDGGLSLFSRQVWIHV